jgi:hypothetical protein
VSPKSNAQQHRVSAATASGLLAGVGVLFFLDFLRVYPFLTVSQHQQYQTELKVMRIYFGLTFYTILLGLNSLIFELKKLNYIFIL